FNHPMAPPNGTRPLEAFVVLSVIRKSWPAARLAGRLYVVEFSGFMTVTLLVVLSPTRRTHPVVSTLGRPGVCTSNCISLPGVALSITCQVKDAVEAGMGVPLNTPALLNENPAGSDPLRRLQAYPVPVPPMAAIVVV